MVIDTDAIREEAEELSRRLPFSKTSLENAAKFYGRLFEALDEIDRLEKIEQRTKEACWIAIEPFLKGMGPAVRLAFKQAIDSVGKA